MQGKWVERVLRFGLLLIVALLLVWALLTHAFQHLFDNFDEFLYLLKQHLEMVGLSSLLTIIFAVPMGIIITRPKYKKYDWIVINFANIGQTIPSLAVLALVMSYLGLGFKSAIFALWFYSILPILRNTIAGIETVSPAILDAGKGMGMTPMEILWKLEIPNSIYPILAGIRTAIVINVGTATLAFLIGAGGLGDWVFTGIDMQDPGIMLSGAFPITLLAITIDFLLSLLEKKLVPKGLQRSIEIT